MADALVPSDRQVATHNLFDLAADAIFTHQQIDGENNADQRSHNAGEHRHDRGNYNIHHAAQSGGHNGNDLIKFGLPVDFQQWSNGFLRQQIHLAQLDQEIFNYSRRFRKNQLETIGQLRNHQRTYQCNNRHQGQKCRNNTQWTPHSDQNLLLRFRK